MNILLDISCIKMGEGKWKKSKKAVNQAVERFKEGEPIVYSAAIAFFAIFSLPPTLLIILWVAGGIFGPEAIREEVHHQFTHAVGEAGADQIANMLDQGRQMGDNVLANILTIAVLLFAATVMFAFFKKGLNSIWGIKPKPEKGALKFLLDRLMSLSIILVLGVLIIASLLADAVLGFISAEVADELFGMGQELMWVLNVIVSYALISAAFALVYKYLPDVKLPWKPVWVGALFTGALVFIGNYLISKIIQSTGVGTTYGAAGSLAAILLWVFYSMVIVLVGALVIKIYALHKGYTVEPRKNAVAVEIKEVKKQEVT